MRRSGKLAGMALGLVATLSGCSEVIDSLTPDRIERGVAVRELRARQKYGYKIRTAIPVGRVRVSKDINDKFEGYAGMDHVQGEIGAEHPFLEGGVSGRINGVNAGVRYKPVSRNWGFEAGGELFQGDYTMTGSLGPSYNYWIK